MKELDGRVCVITGGAGGVGAAMARRFRSAGSEIVLGDVEPAALEAAVAVVGGSTLGVACDVTSAASMDALRDAALERFGGVHIVCLNAGVAPIARLLETSLETWRWVIDVNVMGVVNGLNSFVPALVAQGEGHVVITASSAGLSTTFAMGAYAATKHAVIAIAATLQLELASKGVGVSVLCPGALRTRIFEGERNRPAELAGDTHTAPERVVASYKNAVALAADPDLVAEAAYEAVVADQLFVLPSPEENDTIIERLDAVRAALP